MKLNTSHKKKKMNYNTIGIWAQGYLDAILTGDRITKKQLEGLITRIEELIKQVEKTESESQSKLIIPEPDYLDDDEDLPF
jgi:hypothetical protein